MDSTTLNNYFGITVGLIAILTVFYKIYKKLNTLKVSISPIKDNFFIGWDSDNKWPHRMDLMVCNRSSTPRTPITGELEIISDGVSNFIQFFDLSLQKKLELGDCVNHVFIISDLKLTMGTIIRVHIKDSQGNKYKSNTLEVGIFNPDLNPM